MTLDSTISVVRQQIAAMGCELCEVGVFRPETPGTDASMLLRVWDTDALRRSVPWLQTQNHDGRHIFVRPKGEHNLSMVDDLTADAVAAMDREGFNPAVVVETSPSNFQAWLKHPEQLDKQLSTATARALAGRFHGDAGAADWRHFGRLSGFANRKPKYQDVGATEAEVAAAIRTRDLSKKGAEHRRQDYIERTIRKAGANLLEPSRGR